MAYPAQIQNLTEHAVITVAAIYPAKAANKSATIKDANGLFFSVWPKDLGIYRQGEAYEIEFTSNEKNGTIYRDIRSGRLVTPPSPPPPQFTAQHGPQPPVRPLAAAAQPGERKDGGPGGSGYYRPTSPRDARRMFLCSTLNAFIQTGRIELHRDHILQAITEITTAYDNSIGLEDKTA